MAAIGLSADNIESIASLRAHTAAGPLLAPFLGDEAARAAEWLARIVLSYTLSPGAGVDVRDEVSTRGLVRDFVMPLLVQRTTT